MKQFIKTSLLTIILTIMTSSIAFALPQNDRCNELCKHCHHCHTDKEKSDSPDYAAKQNDEHGWIGIKVINGGMEGVTNIIPGALIMEVDEMSPLFDLGFEEGDLIVEFNGQEVCSAKDLTDKLQNTKPRDKVVLTTVTLNADYRYKYTDFTIRLIDKPVSFESEE